MFSTLLILVLVIFATPITIFFDGLIIQGLVAAIRSRVARDRSAANSSRRGWLFVQRYPPCRCSSSRSSNLDA